MICFTCNKPFTDYKELALHIVANKKSHRKGYRTAQAYLTRQKQLDRKVSMNKYENAPLTDEQKESKQNTKRELSGNKKPVNTVCLRCKRNGISVLEVEHINEPQALMINGRYPKTCINCGGV